MLPQGVRDMVMRGLTEALKIIDPSEIQTKEQAMQALQKLRSSGLPPIDINRLTELTNNPLMNMGFNALGINKQEFKNGLQSLCQPDNPSVMANTIPLLQGIDQLK